MVSCLPWREQGIKGNPGENRWEELLNPGARIMAGKQKRLSAKKRPNRNALCPCGSQRAFKNCCARKWAATSDKPDSLPSQLKRFLVGLALCALLVGGVALAIMRPWEEEPERRPFEYDSDNNRYWNAQHGHWHEGRPPNQPWEYDPERHQFFHPDHNEWRPGRPPPPDERP